MSDYYEMLKDEKERYAHRAVLEERERCVAWAIAFTLITELLDGIESGKWPPQESKRVPKKP